MQGRVEMIGPLGVGKTSLLEAFCSTEQYPGCVFEDLAPLEEARRFCLEDVNNRTYFLQTAYYLYAHGAIRKCWSEATIAVSDFSLLFHHFGYSAVFRRATLLNDLEYSALESLLSALLAQLPPLIGFVHCTADPRTVYNRIQSRGREDETQISNAYLSELCRVATEIVASASVPVLTLELDHHNPVSAAVEMKGFIDSLAAC